MNFSKHTQTLSLILLIAIATGSMLPNNESGQEAKDLSASSRMDSLKFKNVYVCQQKSRPIFNLVIENKAGELHLVAFPGNTKRAEKFKQCIMKNKMDTTREDFLSFAAKNCLPQTLCRPSSGTKCSCGSGSPSRCVHIDFQRDLRKCADAM